MDINPTHSYQPRPTMDMTTSKVSTEARINKAIGSIQAYMDKLRGEQETRDPGSSERLAAGLVAAIALVHHIGPSVDHVDLQRTATCVHAYLINTCAQEGFSLDFVEKLTKNIVLACHVDRHQAILTDAAVRLIQTVISKKDEAEARLFLRTMMNDSPTTTDREMFEQLYRYSVTAWPCLGPEEEGAARDKVAEQILNRPDKPFVLDAQDLALTSLPALPDDCIEIVVTGNRLSSLPRLPDKLTDLDVSFNELTCLPDLPQYLQYLDASQNQLRALPEAPRRLLGLYVTHNKLDDLPESVFSLSEDAVVETDDSLTEVAEQKLRSAISDGTVGPEIKFYRREPGAQFDTLTWTSREQFL
ncbi:hypothetical protein LMG26854_05886 [Achromobacter aegrifaciens]|uniref:hypothetical protein n=1 Tax=Achromobacter aegrifaciens TaxID=1287736 RepID=UPI001465D27E|nr:hypothetical protein [Achromobacter aegrifaciens]CAB3908634.1 hypothetical protein LMG26854_05886 [Achromobacter aegrifaciens]